LRRLLDENFERQALLPIGRAWLTGHEDKPEWNYVWQRLLEEKFEREALLPVGRAWLTGGEHRNGYPQVFKRVYGRWPERRTT
jgi:hypothetical protein